MKFDGSASRAVASAVCFGTKRIPQGSQILGTETAQYGLQSIFKSQVIAGAITRYFCVISENDS